MAETKKSLFDKFGPGSKRGDRQKTKAGGSSTRAKDNTTKGPKKDQSRIKKRK